MDQENHRNTAPFVVAASGVEYRLLAKPEAFKGAKHIAYTMHR